MELKQAGAKSIQLHLKKLSVIFTRKETPLWLYKVCHSSFQLLESGKQTQRIQLKS